MRAPIVDSGEPFPHEIEDLLMLLVELKFLDQEHIRTFEFQDSQDIVRDAANTCITKLAIRRIEKAMGILR